MKKNSYENMAMGLYQVRMYNLFNYGLTPKNYSDVNEAVNGIKQHFQRDNAGFLLSHGVISNRLYPSSKWNIYGIIINEIMEKKKETGEEWCIRYYNKKDEVCRVEPCLKSLTRSALQQSIRETEIYAVLSYRKTWEDVPEIPDEWMTAQIAIHPDMEAVILIKTPTQESIQF